MVASSELSDQPETGVPPEPGKEEAEIAQDAEAAARVADQYPTDETPSSLA